MPKSKIEISLTDFIDFVCKTGSPKLTQVRTVKFREDYSPATDFYKALREGLINNHKVDGGKKGLKNILDSLSDPKKTENYKAAIEGYKKFWGNKKITWFEPPFAHWKIGDVDIKINPELGLDFGGKFLVVKLYLKSDKLTKSRIDQILTLMESQLRPSQEPEVRMAVLDVKNGKIYIKDNDDISLLTLLEGEISSFETIWKTIK